MSRRLLYLSIYICLQNRTDEHSLLIPGITISSDENFHNNNNAHMLSVLKVSNEKYFIHSYFRITKNLSKSNRYWLSGVWSDFNLNHHQKHKCTKQLNIFQETLRLISSRLICLINRTKIIWSDQYLNLDSPEELWTFCFANSDGQRWKIQNVRLTPLGPSLFDSTIHQIKENVWE